MRLLTVLSDRNGSPCISAYTVKCRETNLKTDTAYLDRIPLVPRKAGQQNATAAYEKRTMNSAKSAQVFSLTVIPRNRNQDGCLIVSANPKKVARNRSEP